jgi:hypothetical protein
VCRWIGDLLSLGQSGSPFEKRGCLSMSAVRYHDGTAAVGQLRSFGDFGKQPFERLLYFASCQRANAHNSAFAAGGDQIRQRPIWNRIRT